MSNDNCGRGSVLFSFILGALVGAGLSALLMPTTGEQNRQKLAELRDDLLEKKDELEQEARDKVGEARDKIHEAADKARDTVNRGKEYVESKKDILASAIEAGKEAYSRHRSAPTETADDEA